MNACWYCGRHGEVVLVTQKHYEQVVFKDPVLCATCCGLLGLTGGGGAFENEERWKAEEQAMQILANRYKEQR